MFRFVFCFFQLSPMTFFDDRRFLLSHIRHSFITCDDTGMCEMVMLNETMPHRSYNESYASILDSMLHISSYQIGVLRFKWTWWFCNELIVRSCQFLQVYLTIYFQLNYVNLVLIMFSFCFLFPLFFVISYWSWSQVWLRCITVIWYCFRNGNDWRTPATIKYRSKAGKVKARKKDSIQSQSNSMEQWWCKLGWLDDLLLIN